MRAAILTVSDRSFRGERPDVSGPALKERLEHAGATIVKTALVPDEPALIAQTLIHLTDALGCDLVITTGGTGLSPRDTTPEATRRIIDKELPGMALAIHQASLQRTPFAMLSRGVVGVRGASLILNFPGSPKAVAECFAVVAPVLDHAVKLLRDEDPYQHPNPVAADSPTPRSSCHP